MLKYCLDTTMILYGIEFIISIYGFFLFLWWWLKNRRATSVFIYITFLFFGISVKMCGNIYARHLLLSHGVDVFYEFVHSNFWWIREVVAIVCVSLIVIRMSWRAFYIRPKIENKYKKLYMEYLNNSRKNNPNRREGKDNRREGKDNRREGGDF